MTLAERQDQLQVLGCEIEARPAGAPGAADIAHALIEVEREAADVLVLSFERSATREVEAFVAAEQRCCAGLAWSVEAQADATRIRVAAGADQLDVIERLFARPG